MTWINEGQTREAVLSSLPNIASGFSDLYASFWQQPYVPYTVLELCRLRLAQLAGSALDTGREDHPVDAAKRDNIRDWHQHEAFDAVERACLDFAEVYYMDPASITDEQADAVKSHVGDAGLIVLVEALGVFNGMIRLSLLWQLPTQEKQG